MINSKDFLIELSADKKEKLLLILINFREKTHCTILSLAQLIGNLIASCPAIDYRWLHTKSLEYFKSFSIIVNKMNYSVTIKIPDFVYSELSWWIGPGSTE